MSELFDFGRYAPYIGASYGTTALVIGFLIVQRRVKLKKARDAERESTLKSDS